MYVEILGEKTAVNAASFLQRLVAKAPFQVQKVLTDNGQEFTDRCCATGERDPTGRHRFDRTGENHNIDHRLIKPRHPQTNGRVERCNGRISAVLATTRLDAAQRLEDTLSRSVRRYHHQIPHRALGHIAPVQALQDWQEKRPERFKKKAYNLTGLDRTKVPRGGARPGSGRKVGSGRWGEATQVVRLPVSRIPEIQARPLFTSRVPADFPSPADEYAEGPLDLHDYLIRHPAATF